MFLFWGKPPGDTAKPGVIAGKKLSVKQKPIVVAVAVVAAAAAAADVLLFAIAIFSA